MQNGGGASERPTRVAILATYPAVRAGLRALLTPSGRIDVVTEASDARDFAPIARSGVDVLLVDLESAASAAQIQELVDSAPELGLLLLGPIDGDLALIESLGPRSWGYLLKEAGGEELASAIEAIAQGLVVIQPPLAERVLTRRGLPVFSDTASVTTDGLETLTNREDEVLQLVAQGLPNKTIALRLGISEHTVKFHLTSILAKLGAASRTEAVRLGARRGLIVL
jgi:DNA-binding NarL/FixJ family response regulator